MVDTQKLLSAKELSKKFRVHVNTMYRWIKNGKLPAFKVGGKTSRWMIKQSDVDKILKGK